jgi:hypothetical protein
VVIDVDDTLARGGVERLEFLRYCVMSITMEPLFVFLSGEYRLRPTHAAAVALFDMFCAADAPARLAAYELLPPRELALSSEVIRVRAQWTAMQAPRTEPESEEPEEVRSVAPWPSRALFDSLVKGVRADSHRRLAAASESYDPRLTPQENLPGGQLSASQRQFVDRIWTPIVRPRLAGAGFWQVATI